MIRWSLFLRPIWKSTVEMSLSFFRWCLPIIQNVDESKEQQEYLRIGDDEQIALHVAIM